MGGNKRSWADAFAERGVPINVQHNYYNTGPTTAAKAAKEAAKEAEKKAKEAGKGEKPLNRDERKKAEWAASVKLLKGAMPHLFEENFGEKTEEEKKALNVERKEKLKLLNGKQEDKNAYIVKRWAEDFANKLE
ncbi:MAG: hypothetical protein Q9225_000492 [Loekoesia sp. 1 TL-2023]